MITLMYHCTYLEREGWGVEPTLMHIIKIIIIIYKIITMNQIKFHFPNKEFARLEWPHLARQDV